MTEEEEKWEEEFKEWWNAKYPTIKTSEKNRAYAELGYLEACRKRQEIERLKEIISTQDDYVKLLTEELDELAIFASAHGWKSTRYGQGKKLREKIMQLKEESK